MDDLINSCDRALRALFGVNKCSRPNPSIGASESKLSEQERAHVSGLMRINHTGEICAQALYEGQALLARTPEAKASLLDAADEESDHLSWCRSRLDELNAAPSLLNPLFYSASFAIGAVAGAFGDRVSLGFVEATEDEVVHHIRKHLKVLPEKDEKSRRILEAMRVDEERHAAEALQRGGIEFPKPVKRLMRTISRVMTETTYRI